jgi:hypothetical protein
LGACQRRPLHDHRIPHHIADDDAKVSFESDHVAIDGKTGKPVADVTRYTYHDADTSIVVSFERQKTILQAILTDRAPLLKRIIAQLIGFDGAYHRFTGKVTVEKFEGGVRVERFEDHAIWELMYFGKTRALTAATAATVAWGSRSKSTAD